MNFMNLKLILTIFYSADGWLAPCAELPLFLLTQRAQEILSELRVLDTGAPVSHTSSESSDKLSSDSGLLLESII